MKRRGVVLMALTVLAASVFGSSVTANTSGGLYPDLQSVVPKHLHIQNEHQREMIRFSNGIANTGAGHLQLRPDPPPGGENEITAAVQEILDANGNVVHSQVASTYEYHPEHNHWHIGDVATFEVRYALDDGTGGNYGDFYVNDRGAASGVKVTFCLIDWYKLDDNSPTHERNYFDCYTGLQGISSGWVDQYHQATDGQELDITGAPVGVYYFVTTANPDSLFLESNYTNNTAWASFRLTRDSQGNAQITEIAHSPCSSPGMCGEQATNR